MKKLLSAMLLTALAASLLCAAVAAVKLYEPDEADKDYTAAGWYKVFSIVPENHDYSYIYDKPSSTKGDSQCRADDGERVYVYYTTGGIGKKGTTWAYCSYDSEKKGTVEGFIRFSNLVIESDYVADAPKPTSTPKPTATPKPTDANSLFITPRPTATPKPVDSAKMPTLTTLTVVNCNYWVSLREGPTTKSTRLAEVPKGAQVVGYAYNKHWYAVYYDGQFGYIYADYIQ
ncbi:MAG: SH3 domain-containing protein [Clostridia bacterium]|nr:SH3 domain-containing protein [Clostridia bacterium]